MQIKLINKIEYFSVFLTFNINKYQNLSQFRLLFIIFDQTVNLHHIQISLYNN